MVVRLGSWNVKMESRCGVKMCIRRFSFVAIGRRTTVDKGLKGLGFLSQHRTLRISIGVYGCFKLGDIVGGPGH